MCGIALKMLLHSRFRVVSTLMGVSVAFFLSAAQIGILVGWCNATSAIVRHAAADIWVTAKQVPAFDYGYAIPRNRVYQVRSVPGVAWAEGMLMSWVFWQRADGRRVTIELVGLDESLVGGPWEMNSGNVASVQAPDCVIVDALYCEALGVRKPGDEAEILGTRARVSAVSQGVRTFTAAPFVFASLDSALRYEPYYRPDEITYVLVRCEPGTNPKDVCNAIVTRVPSVEALLSEELALRTVRYWMLETGIGLTVVLTAVLGLVVGTVIVGQTLHSITQDHRAEYATLLALGFGRSQLMVAIFWQAIFFAAAGSCLGGGGFAYAMKLSTATPLSLETTSLISVAMVVVSFGCCLLGSLLAMRTLFSIDPVTVFHR